MARPSSYSEDIADEICGLLIEGLSLRKICDRDDMPDRRTVMRWLDAHPDFAAKCARARELQADLMDDLILDTAEKTTSDNAAAARVKIAAYQWRAAKLAPKKYGDASTLRHTGADGGPVQFANMTEAEIDARLAALAGASVPASPSEEA
ncbi:hypothetical protein [Phenylobacterium sp.]|uniref:terminase small subunit-like protein n=1 Tax=Phenylobacterium sp. TaxID=1871053 RepID=UPI0030025929